CTDNATPTCHAYDSATDVFAGRVLSIRDTTVTVDNVPLTTRAVTILAQSRWKGHIPTGQSVTVLRVQSLDNQAQTEPDWLRQGLEALIFLGSRLGSAAILEGPSRPLDAAAADLALLGPPE